MLKYIFISLIFFASSVSFSQNTPVSSFVDFYSSAETIYAEFTSVLTAGNNRELKGKIYFLKPYKTRVELESNVMVSDGEFVRSYNKRMNRLVISNVDEYDLPLDLNKFLTAVLNPENVKLKSEEKTGFTFLIENVGVGSLNSVTVLTDKKFVITTMFFKQPDSSTVKIKFDKFIAGKKLDESIFQINIPENTKIIDLR